MDTLTHYWNEFWTFFREGLNGVNPIQAAVITLLGVMAVNSFVGLFVAAGLAVVIHILASALLPVIIDHKAFAAPAMNGAFGYFVLTLYILYFVTIGVLFLVKLLIQRARG